jgi:hypothetical protein
VASNFPEDIPRDCVEGTEERQRRGEEGLYSAYRYFGG